MTARFIVGDTRAVTADIPDGSVDLILTSPPFLALRSYLPADHPDKALEIGSEATPAAFIDVLLELTAEWRRILASHGSIVVELGDTYSGSGGAGGDYSEDGLRAGQVKFKQSSGWHRGGRSYRRAGHQGSGFQLHELVGRRLRDGRRTTDDGRPETGDGRRETENPRAAHLFRTGPGGLPRADLVAPAAPLVIVCLGCSARGTSGARRRTTAPS